MAVILIVEDETILAHSMAHYLERHASYSTAVATSGEDGLALVEHNSPDVALVDMRLPGMDGLQVLHRLRHVAPETQVIMMTAYGSVASAVEAMKHGAYDYLSKPIDLDELCIVVDKALAEQRLRRELSYLKGQREGVGYLAQIVGMSAPIRRLREQITRVASLELVEGGGAPTTLILGETGVGKELVAHAIHAQSPRAAGPFITLNCTALPSTLLEAEVFGYEKGAYTDAQSAKPGLFEAAEGGTLFLDEIGHMDMALQAKLLKAIEDKAIRRLGGLHAKTLNVRILAATNRDLEAAMAEGTFRADLYYRLNVLTLQVPPLRDRGEDIINLARHFTGRVAAQYSRPSKALAADAVAALRRYTWPGNVRELAHVMERAILLHDGATLHADDLGLPNGESTGAVVVAPTAGVQVDFSHGGIVLEDVERALILAALNTTAWNRAQAAQLLGLSRETLRYRIEKFQLRPPE